jgi:murein DD-endopeptidase MepM/ murein hydrolase activator NlpD
MRGRLSYRWLGIPLSILLVLLALTQCWTSDPLPSPALGKGSKPGLALTAILSPTLAVAKTPTAVLVPLADPQDLSQENGAAQVSPPTVAPDPLRFVFPDARPEPVSAWRPPLYPVPWAPTPYDHFYFSRPIAADEVNWPLADYRYGGVFFDDQVHTGVDFPAAEGTPVISTGDGKVVWAGWGLYRGILNDYSDPYGKAVVIRHDFGYQGLRLYTVYGHLDRIDVLRGAHVAAGEQIGLVGDTGFVTGPHLHFEVRVGESDFFTTYNPELWLVPPQGWGVAVGRVMDTAGYAYLDEIVQIQSRQTGQVWKAIPYAEGPINSDPYYQENMVISDLPAGLYDVSISYAGRFYNLTIEIFPGRVTYFSFQGRNGFSLQQPVNPGETFNPLESGLESP